jgi:hypothetical protein
MRSSTARALLALVLLAVALEAVPTEQQTTVLRPLTLTATFNIEPGDAVAPHIYDWYLDGVDDYVLIRLSDSLKVSSVTLEVALYRLGRPPNYRTVFGMGAEAGGGLPGGAYVLFNGAGGDGVAFQIWNTANRYKDIGFTAPLHVWTHCACTYDASTGEARCYRNGSLHQSASGWAPPDPTSYRDIYVSYTLPFMVAHARIYSRALSDSEIARAYNANIVSANGLVLFLDATFYNGTHYVDLSGNGNHGVGYGGVSRVLSSRPHLYLVKGLHGDGLVHFRFFPVNAVVDVYNATTNSLVASFTIDGPANPAGLVEDYAVSLGPGLYRLAVYTTVYVQVAQPALPAFKLVVAHFKAEMGPGCRVYIDYTAWPKAEPRAECGLQTDATFLTGLPAGATVRVWNETVLYEVTASSTGVAVLGGLKHGAYEVKVYSDTLQIPHDHLLRLDPLSGLRQFFGFWDRLTYNLFTPVFVVGLVLAVYLRTWSAILTALVALAAHIVIAPDNIWIRGLLALALAVAVYIAVWRRTSPF